MKLSTTLAASFAVLALGAWGVSMACDHDKKIQTSAASASAAKTECTAAQAAACKAKGTSATTASTASSCAAHKTTSAMASGAACNHGDAASASAKSGACSGKGMTTAVAMTAHGDCDACADMQLCAQELEAAGAHTQIVPLKNGVMFVYTADSPGQVRAVQAAMVRRGEKIGQLVSAGDKAHLCAECKQIRGAMASGKLNREVVNIEGGSLTLMTSNDPKMVSKIHSMVDVRMAARTKS